jgi:hypothetical protein
MATERSPGGAGHAACRCHAQHPRAYCHLLPQHRPSLEKFISSKKFELPFIMTLGGNDHIWAVAAH